MKRLHTDGALSLGGSVIQMIEYNRRNCCREEFVDNLATRLTYRCKTKPPICGRRCAQLVGVIYDQFNGDEYLLDVACDAINLIND